MKAHVAQRAGFDDLAEISDFTPSTVSSGFESISSNRRGNESHKLKQRRQP